MKPIMLTAVALCSLSAHAASTKGGITREPFGKLADGTAVELFTLTNAHGVQAKITNYGGIVTALSVPDRKGKFADVALGSSAPFSSMVSFRSDCGLYFQHRNLSRTGS